MAPIATEQIQQPVPVTKSVQAREPLKYSGSLDSYKAIDLTPVIGTEYAGIDLAEVLKAPNSDELIRDIAIKSMCRTPATVGLR